MKAFLSKLSRPITVLITLAALVIIGLSAYFLFTPQNITRILSFAATCPGSSRCTIGSTKTCPDGKKYCCDTLYQNWYVCSSSTQRTCTAQDIKNCDNQGMKMNPTTCQCYGSSAPCTSTQIRQCELQNKKIDPVTCKCTQLSSSSLTTTTTPAVTKCTSQQTLYCDKQVGMTCKVVNGQWGCYPTSVSTSASSNKCPLDLIAKCAKEDSKICVEGACVTAPPSSSSGTSDTSSSSTTGASSGQQQKNPCEQKQSQSGNQSGTGDKTSGCNDYDCKNISQGGKWAIVNCEGDDADGDIQLCNKKGRIGVCQDKEFCCPDSGKKWTEDMTSCPKNITLSVTPSEVPGGQQISVTWSGIPYPTTSDWLGMYAQAATDQRSTVDWNYVSPTTCSKNKGSAAVASGTCQFMILSTIPSGVYELRLYASDTYNKLATSNTFTVKGAVPSGSPTPTGMCCACPTPSPYYAQSSCNGACMTSFNCPTGYVCLLADTYGWVCRNPACPDTSSCSCSTTPSTPTPTPTKALAYCDDPCTTSSDCKSGYRCAYISSRDTSVCRNPSCYSSRTCVCPTITPTVISKGTDITPTSTPAVVATLSGTPVPTGLRLSAVPTELPSPTPIPVNPPLTITPFTDNTGKAPQKFTLTGTSDPFTEITIQFTPDSLGQTTTTDAKGDWRYIMTKSLTTGKKDVMVTARTAEGGETQVKQSFTVKGGRSFSSLFIGFFIILLIGGIGYFIYQRQTRDQSTLFSQFPPFSPTEEGASGTTEGESNAQSPDTTPAEGNINFPSEETGESSDTENTQTPS